MCGAARDRSSRAFHPRRHFRHRRRRRHLRLRVLLRLLWVSAHQPSRLQAQVQALAALHLRCEGLLSLAARWPLQVRACHCRPRAWACPAARLRRLEPRLGLLPALQTGVQVQELRLCMHKLWRRMQSSTRRRRSPRWRKRRSQATLPPRQRWWLRRRLAAQPQAAVRAVAVAVAVAAAWVSCLRLSALKLRSRRHRRQRCARSRRRCRPLRRQLSLLPMQLLPRPSLQGLLPGPRRLQQLLRRMQLLRAQHAHPHPRRWLHRRLPAPVVASAAAFWPSRSRVALQEQPAARARAPAVPVAGRLQVLRQLALGRRRHLLLRRLLLPSLPQSRLALRPRTACLGLQLP